MSYPLRLPAELDAEAREHCQRLGISLNALIAVALDAYLRGSKTRAAAPRGVKGSRVPLRAPQAKPAVSKPLTKLEQVAALPYPDPNGGTILYDADRSSWRNFHHPDMWPVADQGWEGGDRFGEGDFDRLEEAYWAEHDLPKPIVQEGRS